MMKIKLWIVGLSSALAVLGALTGHAAYAMIREGHADGKSTYFFMGYGYLALFVLEFLLEAIRMKRREALIMRASRSAPLA